MSLSLVPSNFSDPFDSLKNQIESRLMGNSCLTDGELGELSLRIKAIAQTAQANLKDDLTKLESSLSKLYHQNAAYSDSDIAIKEIVQNLEDISKKQHVHQLHQKETISTDALSIDLDTIDPIEAQKIEEAKVLADYDGCALSQGIQSFGIKNQKALVEIATIAVSQDERGTSEYIQNYGITDSDKRFEIAKIAASQSGRATSYYIKNYGITDKDKLVEIAKIAAGQNGDGTSENIQNYGITDQAKLFEIAKIAASQDGQGTSLNIKNYGITDPDKRFELAKIAARQNGGATTLYIQKYGITDPAKLYEIAKIAASQDGLPEFIEYFRITDQAKLYEIAKIGARQNGKKTSKNIYKCKITDTNKHFEIAKMAARQNGKGTSRYIQRYAGLNEQQRTAVFLIACANDIDSLGYLDDYHTSSDFAAFFSDLAMVRFSDVAIALFTQLQSKFEARWPGQFKGVFEEIGKLDINNTKDQRQKLDNAREWLIKTAAYMHLNAPAVQDPELWRRIYLYRDPAMRPELSALAAELLSNEQKYSNYLTLFQNVEHLRIPLLYLCQRSDPADFRESIEAIRKERSFREGPRLKGLIDVLHLFKEAGGQLSNQEINILLKNAVETNPKDKIKTNFFAIQGIIACGGLDDLKQAISRQDLDLSRVYRTVFNREIDVEVVADFANRYEKTFASSTLPASLLTYVSRLKQLPPGDREKALSLLGVFVRVVLDGTYANERYSTLYSPHLSKVFKGDLEQKWRENRKVTLGANEAMAEKTFDYRKFLHTKIIIDKHLDNEAYPAIVEYLTSGDASIRERLDADIASQGEEADPKLVLQRDLIDLADGIKEPEQLQKLLKAIKEQLERLPAELKNDIKGLTQKKSLGDSAKWTLENTDDFDVLLNCGTHVSGSCQRVDGNPNSNKCLLSYLMDGKNRMLAIRNERGVTVARCIFRLLHDQKTGKPVLFQERIYPDPLDSRYEEALYRFAGEEANRLALPLYTEGSDPASIESLGGRAPWEYVDAVGGVKPDSRYIITAAKRIL